MCILAVQAGMSCCRFDRRDATNFQQRPRPAVTLTLTLSLTLIAPDARLSVCCSAARTALHEDEERQEHLLDVLVRHLFQQKVKHALHRT